MEKSSGMRKRLSLVAGIAVTIVVVVLLVYGGVNLSEFTTQLAVGLTLLLPIIAAFAFNPEINKLIKSRIKKIENSPTINIEVKETKLRRNDNVFEVSSRQVVKILGQPQQPIQNGIQHYTSRSELPSFGEMLSMAKSTVDMSAITFTIVALQHYHDLEIAVSKGVHITFLMLDPNSQYVESHSKSLDAAEDIGYQIRKSLGILCQLKKNYADRVSIRTYDSFESHSITVIDKYGSANAWLKIEYRYQASGSNSRPSDAVFKKDNESFFEQYLPEYNDVYEKSKPYDCSSALTSGQNNNRSI